MKPIIPLFKVFMSKEASKSVAEVLNSGYIGQGPKVEQFESELKSWLNNDYVVTVNSATSGEHLALHLLKKPTLNTKYYCGTIACDNTWPGLKPGDEVLASALTCTASNWPILANNLRIKWVDVDERDLNMDLDDLARKISSKTKVIMLVHWGGYPVDLDRVKEIQNRAKTMYGFRPAVIEDCAHAIGSLYKGKKLGNHGNICSFSFQAIKHMTTIDGGMLILPYEELYKRAKLLRWYGIDRDTNKKDFRCELDIVEWGFKFHMNDVNAAVGLENLKHVDDIIEKHRSNASYYNEELKDIEGVSLLENKENCKSSYWLYSMLVERKSDFMDWMRESNIVVSQVHERNDIHSCVGEFRSQLPGLDRVAPRLISIPVGWWVSKENREYIVDRIKKGW